MLLFTLLNTSTQKQIVSRSVHAFSFLSANNEKTIFSQTKWIQRNKKISNSSTSCSEFDWKLSPFILLVISSSPLPSTLFLNRPIHRKAFRLSKLKRRLFCYSACQLIALGKKVVFTSENVMLKSRTSPHFMLQHNLGDMLQCNIKERQKKWNALMTQKLPQRSMEWQYLGISSQKNCK